MNKARRPFWLPASNYYVLAVAVSTMFFFLVWGILHDGGDEMPWVTAGISASMLLCGAVILREIILRRARSRYLLHRRAMDNRVQDARAQLGDSQYATKLTLERNAAILEEIKRKSDAAKVLNKFSSGHREVFEFCSEYISRNESELKTVSASSPRLSALLKGRAAATNFHRFHLLRWAEIESRTLANEAISRADAKEKIEAAQNALSVIDSALRSYPLESSLLESRELLRDVVVSMKVSRLVEEADRAAFNRNYAEAKSLYRDALFYLGRDSIQSHEREQVAMKINAAIERVDEQKIGE
jgi:hypothetical protein